VAERRLATDEAATPQKFESPDPLIDILPGRPIGAVLAVLRRSQDGSFRITSPAAPFSRFQMFAGSGSWFFCSSSSISRVFSIAMTA
jgi:hypothetical protein